MSKESNIRPIVVPGKVTPESNVERPYTEAELAAFDAEAKLDEVRDIGEVDIISGSLAVSRTIRGSRLDDILGDEEVLVLAEEFDDQFYVLPDDIPTEGFSDTFYPETAQKIFEMLPDQELIL